jgi:hypothetical protein
MRSIVLAITIVLSAILPAAVLAQIPSPFAPPSFGTEYPAGSPVLNHDMRRYRDWQLTVSVRVPTSQLRAVLPAGYEVANPAADVSIVSIALVLQERVEFVTSQGAIPVGSYGPVDEVLVVTTAQSPAGIMETVILDNLRSTPEAVNMTNAVFGPGSARLPDMLRMELAAEPGGQLHRFTANVVSGRLNIGASAVFADSAITFVRRRVSPNPFRYVDSSIQPAVANRSLRAGTSGDLITVPASDITFKRDDIHLPHGTLTVLGVASGTIFRWQEFVQKLQ